jgi:predicted nucleotidyltransferase component of viral defense system
MDLFDQLVDEALQQRQDLAPLRIVVEKELLHHDILRVLSSTGLLTKLTFIGGTCLRACYGSNRLSEDLDFTGGADFTKEHLTAMAQTLIDSLHTKYGLSVEVSEPVRESGNVDTWKIKIQTRPDRKDMPAQRINIDVCAIPSYESQPMMLLNPYRVDMGTDGLLIQAESREEIFTDKLVAFALRPNRIKNRDLWDMAWLHQQAVKPQFALLPNKLKDHGCTTGEFIQLFNQRAQMLVSHPEIARGFRDEMRRFLPADIVSQTVEQDAFWGFLTRLMLDLDDVITRVLAGDQPGKGFLM